MTDINRIRQAFDYLKSNRKITNQTEFAKFIGKQKSFVSEIMTGKRDINEHFVHSISEAFPELNHDWLLTGNGEMLQEVCTQQTVTYNPKNFKLVPMYNMDARGGFGTNDEVDCAEYVVDIIPFKDAKDDDICVPVSGKSMMPTYAPGTVILLHEIEQWRDFLETGQIYVLVLVDGRRLLKELRRSEEDRKNNYLCISHNPDFEPVELPRKLINKVFLVKAMYQKTTI